MRLTRTLATAAAAVLAIGALSLAAATLGAQATTIKPNHVPVQPTIEKPAQPTVSKVPPLTLTTWGGSLQVSSDGVHWSGAASTSWANPCSDAPAGCGQFAPATPVHLRWQAWDHLVPEHAMAALNGTYYYYRVQSQLTGPSSPAPAAACDGYSATGLATSNAHDAHALPNLKPGDSMVCSYTVRTQDASGKFYDTAPVTFTIHVTAAHP